MFHKEDGNFLSDGEWAQFKKGADEKKPKCKIYYHSGNSEKLNSLEHSPVVTFLGTAK